MNLENKAKMKPSFFLFTLFIITLISCDFSDNKLLFKNNTSENIYIIIFKEINGEQYLIKGPKLILPRTGTKIELLNQYWKNLLKINERESIVMYSVLSNERINFSQFVNLIKNGKSKKFIITKNNMNSKKWTIQYPQDFD